MVALKGLTAISALALAGFGLSYRPLPSQSFSPLTSTSSTLQNDKDHPAHTTGWVDTRLYFGLGPADAPNQGVTETVWRNFLDQEVTSRFPSGLTVVDVYGQWKSRRSARVERIRSKMLIIDYPATAENSARVDAIRAAWKRRTGDQSVLRVTQPADVSF